MLCFSYDYEYNIGFHRCLYCNDIKKMLFSPPASDQFDDDGKVTGQDDGVEKHSDGGDGNGNDGYDGQESEVAISVISNGDECADNLDEDPIPTGSSTPLGSSRPRKTLGPRKTQST